MNNEKWCWLVVYVVFFWVGMYCLGIKEFIIQEFIGMVCISISGIIAWTGIFS